MYEEGPFCFFHFSLYFSFVEVKFGEVVQISTKIFCDLEIFKFKVVDASVLEFDSYTGLCTTAEKTVKSSKNYMSVFTTFEKAMDKKTNNVYGKIYCLEVEKSIVIRIGHISTGHKLQVRSINKLLSVHIA